MIWASTLQIQKHEYFSGLDFIILFVGILSLYAINLSIVSLFAYSPFTFLAMFIYDIQVSRVLVSIFQLIKLIIYRIKQSHCCRFEASNQNQTICVLVS